MPTRRAFVGSLGAAVTASFAGCVTGALTRPAVQLSSGHGHLHPAAERYVTGGLEPGDTRRARVDLTTDRAPEYVGPDADAAVRETLGQRDDGDVFHAIVEYRSTPDAPIRIGVTDARWRNRGTLVLEVAVEPMGSLSDIDDPEVRTELQSADELVYTSVWSLTPSLDELPDTVDLELATG